MGALLSLPVTLLNSLLPFTNTNTPLYQDLIHTAILCGTLYFAPQIADWYNTQQAQTGVHDEQQTQDDNIPSQPAVIENLEEPPRDERLVLQHDEDNEGPPPQAPTPPPHNVQQHARVEDDPHGIPRDPNNFIPPEAGPANDRPRPTPANRTVGAKKAKSLARKDQRRAYHEFHRQEAELRKLQDAEGAEEREAALNAEKERRAKIEEEIRDKEREERERVKKEREKEAAEEAERREQCLARVKSEVLSKGAVDLVEEAWKEGKDRVWVERLVRASGLLTLLQRDGAHAMLTGHGWLVRVDEELMAHVYADAEMHGAGSAGKVSFGTFGDLLEKAVLARAKA
ncbi:hypothetical protein ACN47E_006573 [Coniothyrium glycines]